MFVTRVISTPALCASWARARFSSRRVIANQRSLGIFFALFIAIRQFVLHGLPTTSTRTSAAAFLSIACPWPTKILPLMPNKSLRSIPALRGTLPTSKAQLMSRKPSSRSAVGTTDCKSGNAQSCSSITTPSSAPSAAGISIKCRASGWSGPNISPDAIRKSSE